LGEGEELLRNEEKIVYFFFGKVPLLPKLGEGVRG